MTQIGQQAKAIRTRLGDSQEAIARRAGVSTATYSRIENGKNQPSLPTLLRIADALGVTLDELAGDPLRAA